MKFKVSIINESFSSNLGDQAITIAIGKLLEDYFEVNLIGFTKSMSNPPDYSIITSRRKSLLKRVARMLPVDIRANVRWYLLGDRTRERRRFSKGIYGSTFILLGGGQLIKNNASLFCNHIAALNSAAKEYGIPIAIVGVGVDKKMNRYNWSLIGSTIKTSSIIALRDRTSRDRITSQFPDIEAPVVMPDLAFSLVNNNRGFVKRDVDFAINVMTSTGMIQADSTTNKVNNDKVQDMWLLMAKDIIDRGDRLALYTTGSLEDEREAETLRSRIKSHLKTDVELFHPSSLEDLLVFMHRCDKVFASRMHAGILAYISRCNAVVLNWDDKVRGVWSVVDEERRVVDLIPAVSKGGYKNILKTLDRLTVPDEDKLAEIRCCVETVLKSEVIDTFVTRKPLQ